MNERISKIINQYVEEDGSCTQAAVRDIMIELQHYCAMNNLDFTTLRENAETGFQEEIDEACFEAEEEEAEDEEDISVLRQNSDALKYIDKPTSES